jgi:hypothetical protein
MLVPSTPRWDIRLSAIWRIRRLVAEPSPGGEGARGSLLAAGDGAVEPGSDEWESILIKLFLRSLIPEAL